MEGVAAHAETDQLGVDFSATCLGAFVFFEHHRGGAIAEHETITIHIPGSAGPLGVIVAGLTALLMPDGLSAENLFRVVSGDAQASEISWTIQLFPTVFFLLFWFAISSTPGKLSVRGVIRDERTLGEPEWWQLIVRYLGYFPSTLCLGLGFFWIIWDEKHQGWHDKLARTVVVETE